MCRRNEEIIQLLILIIAGLVYEAQAFWRLPCQQRLTVGLVDPIVQFGVTKGDHLHTIHGGNAFSANASNEVLLTSSCTSCAVRQDKSAYWTPALYFQHSNGSFTLVDQMGGMVVYYLLRGENITVFPAGFRMVAGDSRLRNSTYRVIEKSLWEDSDRTEPVLRQKAVGFNCLRNLPDETGALSVTELYDSMSVECVRGLRAEVVFPSCWNGRDLDHANHRDHMRYPSTVDDDVCPEGFNKRLITLFYETLWNVTAFAGQTGHFVLANGDPTGLGYHGDFMNGWDIDVLQSALRDCTSDTGILEECAIFDIRSVKQQQQCKLPSSVDDFVGPLLQLPGCKTVQYGPAYASPGTGCTSYGVN